MSQNKIMVLLKLVCASHSRIYLEAPIWNLHSGYLTLLIVHRTMQISARKFVSANEPDELELTFEALHFQDLKYDTPQYGAQNTKKHTAT